MITVRRLQSFILCGICLSALTGVHAQVRDDTISGRLVDQSGEAVAGAMIRLGGPGTPREVKSKGDGSFVFSAVKPGLYSVYAESAGMTLTEAARVRPGEKATLTLVPAGVITGRVTDQNGDPVVEVRVAASLTRRNDGTVPRYLSPGLSFLTDDRGIYRIYGLAPGHYIVGANAALSVSIRDGEFADELPVFYPSGDRADATELEVGIGQEISGIDIKYRALTGKSISGMIDRQGVSQEPPPGWMAQVSVYQLPDEYQVKIGAVLPRDDHLDFTVSGLADGDYEVVAQWFLKDGSYSSAPYRVKLKGADVKGITLKLQPQGTISGTIAIDRSTCPNALTPALEEVEVRLVSEKNFGAATANVKGEFQTSPLKPDTFRLFADPPGEHTYLKSISAPKLGEIERKGVEIKHGEKVTGLVMTIARDGAQLSGKATGSGRKRIFLVPVDSAQSDIVHKYFQSVTGSEGVFSIRNIAPGEYFLYASDYVDSSEHPVVNYQFDDKSRARLREMASQFGTRVKLTPCQSLKI